MFSYVVYSWPPKQGGEYSKVEADTYLAARAKIEASVGLLFGMHLDEKTFLPLIDEFQLKEVEL